MIRRVLSSQRDALSVLLAAVLAITGVLVACGVVAAAAPTTAEPVVTVPPPRQRILDQRTGGTS